MIHLDRHVPRLGLWICEHLFVIHHGAGRNTLCVKQFEPFVRGLFGQALLKNFDQFAVVFDSISLLREAGIVNEFLSTDDLACQAPEPLRSAAYRDMAVGCREDLIRGTAAMPLAKPFRCLSRCEE